MKRFLPLMLVLGLAACSPPPSTPAERAGRRIERATN